MSQIGAPAEAIFTCVNINCERSGRPKAVVNLSYHPARDCEICSGYEPRSVVNGLRGKLPLLGLNALPGCDGRTEI
jgi:hypothetical protein